MKDAAQVYADRLEQQEAAEGSAESLYDCLRTVGAPSFLLEIAATVAPYAGIAQAIYRRALEIGVAEETARAYLAQSHLFLGNTEEARKLVEPGVPANSAAVGCNG